ncbi:MAG: RNA polymerase sigma factor [Candidatus Cyclobacteriaceae bacterium M3_2C_046]
MSILAEQIIEKAKKGNKSCLNQLVNQWYQRIYNFSYKYFSEHDMAMEVTQRTFIAMYKNLDKLQDNEKFGKWLYQIAYNNCKEEDRKEKRRKVFPFLKVSAKGDDYLIRNAAEQFLRPEDIMDRTELSEIMIKALNRLNPEQRMVIIMKEYEGFKFREIADMLNISDNTVKSRMYYGLTSLKKILHKWNINKKTVRYEL